MENHVRVRKPIHQEGLMPNRAGFKAGKDTKGTTVFLQGPRLAPRRCRRSIIWFSSSCVRRLWPGALRRRVSCGCGVHGAGCDGAACTGVIAELNERHKGDVAEEPTQCFSR